MLSRSQTWRLSPVPDLLSLFSEEDNSFSLDSSHNSNSNSNSSSSSSSFDLETFGRPLIRNITRQLVCHTKKHPFLCQRTLFRDSVTEYFDFCFYMLNFLEPVSLSLMVDQCISLQNLNPMYIL